MLNPTAILAQAPALLALRLFLLTSPLAIVVVLSLVIGLAMVVLFGYTSDQKAIKIAKDQLKAHLLAVRLFRDQLPVVMGSYGKILRGTGRYLRLAFMPLLYVIIPITLLIVQVDRYLGSTPVPLNTPFLVTVEAHNSDALNALSLNLPPEVTMTAPPVHVPAENLVVWRLRAEEAGHYEVKVSAGAQSAAKTICVGTGLARISPVRLRGQFWNRMLSSAEPAISADSPIEAISVNYPDRNIEIAGYGINWIVLFFVLSMIAGFAFKEILGIQI
jgi:hypothetical protein